MRRFLDLTIILVTLPILVPMATILVIVKLFCDGRPIFYNSTRIGRLGAEITVFKFRTMILDRSIITEEIQKYNGGGFEAIPLSSRVYTDAGRVLEKFQLVELPQILNIFLNQMSFIGYRPLPQEHLKELKNLVGVKLVNERQRYSPGVTGFAQLIGKNNLTPIARLKIEIAEAQFFDNKQKVFLKLFIYIYLIFATISLVLAGKIPFLKPICNKYITQDI